ncbi:hypothetical protein [Nonomuraea sp. NPDC049695]|uniref:hypothetical protein n=1 Tax=Nonomuraea sp. NPDC049695 TaxID=3154734 RepID=UPI0034260376
MEALSEVGFLQRERIVRAPDAYSAGTRDAVDVLEVGEVGVRRLDGLGVRLLLPVLGERAVDAGNAGGLALALAGAVDDVPADADRRGWGERSPYSVSDRAGLPVRLRRCRFCRDPATTCEAVIRWAAIGLTTRRRPG